jgi:ATP-dependent Zn protease
VKGNTEAKEELSDLVGYLSSPSKYENVKIPKGILLSMCFLDFVDLLIAH